MGLSVSLRSSSCLDLAPSIVDLAVLDFAPLMRSHACLGFALPVLDGSAMGLLLSLRQFLQVDSLTSLLGCSKIACSPFLSYSAFTELSISVHSPTCLDLALPAVDAAYIDSCLLVRSFACLGFVLLVLLSSNLGLLPSARQPV